MNRTKWMAASCFAMVLALVGLGCSGKAGSAVPLSAVTGQHPTTWLADHWAGFVQTPDQCRTCHGSTSDPASTGGVSKVSCFSCHTKGVEHPGNWADAAQHGALGAELAPVANVVGVPPAMAGFAHCSKCHGSTYDNGPAVSCKSCHTKAPHPDKPWIASSTKVTSHVNTDLGNAPECAKCHTAGANSHIQPLVTPPAGTTPGCFNNTLCHGMGIPAGA